MRFNPLHNLPLKIGAVLLAMLLWVHVATNKPYEYQIEMPLVLENVAAGLLQTNELPTTVTVRVKTSGKQLIALDATQPKLTLSAAEYREGAFERDLSDDDAMAAFDQVYENVGVVFPRKIFLRFERAIEKSVLVKSQVKLAAARGHMTVGRAKIEPEMVNVLGPASAVKRIHELETESLELSGLTTTTTQQVRLVALDSLGIKLADSLVRITATVEPMTETLLSDLVVYAPHGFNFRQFAFSPEAVTIKIGMPQSLATPGALKTVRVSFPLPDFETDSVRVGLAVKVPPDAIYLAAAGDSILVFRKR